MEFGIDEILNISNSEKSGSVDWSSHEMCGIEKLSVITINIYQFISNIIANIIPGSQSLQRVSNSIS